MISSCFGYFSGMKICNLITVRPYTGFQKFLTVDGFGTNFFFELLLLALFQISLHVFNNSSSSIKKDIHLVLLSKLFT